MANHAPFVRATDRREAMKLLGKVKAWIKRCICRHEHTELMRWHWTHGPFGNDPLTVEAEYKCEDCGELLYSHLDREESYRWAEAMGNHKKWRLNNNA